MLLAEKVILSDDYSDFINLFLKKPVKILPKQIGINKYANKLVKNKEPAYGPIYSLALVELKTVRI